MTQCQQKSKWRGVIRGQIVTKEKSMLEACLGVLFIAAIVGIMNYLVGYRGEDDGIEGG